MEIKIKMKIVLVMLGVLFSGGVFCQDIEFQDGTFEEVMALAKRENKPIFMDCYTVWCRPCKVLAKKVFPQEKVSAFFNEHYVSITMDMEKGEGIELAKYYNVRAYPTLLFLDADGELLVTQEGAVDAETLIEKGREALELRESK